MSCETAIGIRDYSQLLIQGIPQNGKTDFVYEEKRFLSVGESEQHKL